MFSISSVLVKVLQVIIVTSSIKPVAMYMYHGFVVTMCVSCQFYFKCFFVKGVHVLHTVLLLGPTHNYWYEL